MAMNKYYTKEEIKRLRILMKDYPEETPKFIAKKALDLGVCTDRTIDAVARQINKLKRIPLDPPKPVIEIKKPEQIKEDDIWVSDRDLYVTAKKYESLIKTIFDNATLWTGAYEDGLFFNVPSLRAWLKEYDAERFDKRLTELLDNNHIYGRV